MSHPRASAGTGGERFTGQELPAEYVAFFECFNSQRFFEAHEVLEKLWLPRRQEPNGAFYKGLIQLAGAFVHVQKSRPGPAASLLKLAQANLVQFKGIHERLDVAIVLERIDLSLKRLETNDSSGCEIPKLHLLAAEGRQGP
jgi:predicted metal-dependent hydrolase